MSDTTGHIFAFYTGDRVRWEQDDEGNTLEDPIVESGWVDRSWSPYTFFDSRNDVRPAVDVDLSDREALQDEITDALGFLDGGYEDNGDGTFYAREGYAPFHDNPEGWEYTYALHFKRKYLGKDGYVEVPWHPVMDGGIEL